MASSTSLKSIIIFTDGACSGNPGRGGWGAVITLPEGEVIELGAGNPQTTNNAMELSGTIEALRYLARTPGDVVIYTDSVYVIRGITQWIWGWRKRNWISSQGDPVANRELWERLLQVVTARKSMGSLDWKFVKGHSGVPGNERTDVIAVSFSQGKYISLYRGPLIQYSVAIYDLPDDRPLPEMKSLTGPKPQAICYLSLIGRQAMRHKSWPACERRVKGQSGAKFKKAMTEEEVDEILGSWGIDPRDVVEDQNV